MGSTQNFKVDYLLALSTKFYDVSVIDDARLKRKKKVLSILQFIMETVGNILVLYEFL